jgi:hypothetical protein
MIAFLPILSMTAETIIEAVMTPISKKIAFAIKRQQAIEA